jgi:hypothetical protein
MYGQVGYWGSSLTGGVAICFDLDMMKWLDGQGTDRRILVSVDKWRKLTICPDPMGGHVDVIGKVSSCPFRYVSTPTNLILEIDIPLFELLQMKFTEVDGILVTELPCDHLLPWPKLKLDCQTYEAEQLALDALQARMNSLVASGFTSFTSNRMPQRLSNLLPRGTYQECIRTAKLLAGIK